MLKALTGLPREPTLIRMKRYAILRVEKVKRGGLSAAVMHNGRARETRNADPERRGENSTLVGGSPKAVYDRLDKRLATVKRKISQKQVVALEYLVSASEGAQSPEARDAYLMDAYQWIIARHGAENILHATIHRDEATGAHLHVLAAPIQTTEKGRVQLSASPWVDGSARLSKMQSDFAEAVAVRHGLERGILGSVARHERVKRGYGAMDAAKYQELPRDALLARLGALEANLERAEAQASADRAAVVEARGRLDKTMTFLARAKESDLLKWLSDLRRKPTERESRGNER